VFDEIWKLPHPEMTGLGGRFHWGFYSKGLAIEFFLQQWGQPEREAAHTTASRKELYIHVT